MTDSLNISDVFSWFPSNSTYAVPGYYDVSPADAVFICCATFCIFTMQTGFALLESGMVSSKNQVNIMMKNIADMTIGGTSFWLFGYALVYGRSLYTNWFCGFGDFLVDQPVNDVLMGQVMIGYFYQMSFATTSTSIVSGAIAERVNFKAYCIFAFLNSVTYSVAAGWIWSNHGFLNNLGAVEISGSGPIHIIGGMAGLVGTVFIGPRIGRFDKGTDCPPMGNPKDACVGMFILWWGWIAFCVASVYGVSGRKWEYALRGGVTTTLGTFGAGFFSIVYSYIKYKGKPAPVDIINGILSALVAMNCGCPFFKAWEAMFVGAFAAFVTIITVPIFCKLGVDDPISATSVHLLGGVVGVLSVGVFAESPDTLGFTDGRSGVLRSGEWYLLGVQAFAVLCYSLWSFVASCIIMYTVNWITPFRMTPEHELLGADLVEHGIEKTHTEARESIEGSFVQNLIVNDQDIKCVNRIRQKYHTYRDNLGFDRNNAIM